MTPLPVRRASRGRWEALWAAGLAAVCLTTLSLCGVSCSRTQTVPPITSAPALRIPPPTITIEAPPELDVMPVDWSTSPWDPRQSPRDWKYIVIHHTATPSGSVESIHRTHLARKDANGNPWRGIGYHFVIGNGQGMPDGAIEPTFRWRDQLAGAHAGNAVYNNAGVGICLIGNFEKHAPTSAQLESLAELTQTLSDRYGISPQHIKRHADVKATACPGRYFPMQELTQILSGEANGFDELPVAVP